VILAEDSGLSIDALNGFPGVKSKDFIKECGGISNSFMKIEKLLETSCNYSACLHSAIALYIPSHDFLTTSESKDYGTLCFPPRGTAGRAFDPIFIPKGYDKTFSELGITMKLEISHRTKALKEMFEHAATKLR